MFKIVGKTIHCTRGDRGTFRLNSNVPFKIGEKIKFSIVERKNFSNVVLEKELIVDEESNEFYITLTSEDTTIGNIINKPKIYWYEIEYNDDQTIVGYDEDGAKEFILYPEALEKGD